MSEASFWRRHRGWIIGQVVLWVAVVAVLRAAVVPAERCPPVTAASLDRGIDEGTAWLVRGQRGDGRFLYGFHRDSDTVNTGYNTTRHAGVMDALYRTGHTESADAGLAWARRNLVRDGDRTALAPPGEDANAGANALLVVALLDRRARTGERRQDEFLHRLARFLESQVTADGRVLQYWRPATRSAVPGVYGKYTTGEAFYALAYMNRTFPGEGWDASAHRIAGYLATRRDAVEGYALREPDHWAAYGLAALAPAGLTPAEVGYARWLAGYFGFLVRFDAQHVGRPLDIQSESGASLGTDGEGASALWRLTAEEPSLADLRGDLRTRAVCLGGILAGRQAGPSARDPRERGAWFAGDYTQMDDQQHAVAALIGAREALAR